MQLPPDGKMVIDLVERHSLRGFDGLCIGRAFGVNVEVVCVVVCLCQVMIVSDDAMWLLGVYSKLSKSGEVNDPQHVPVR